MKPRLKFDGSLEDCLTVIGWAVAPGLVVIGIVVVGDALGEFVAWLRTM